MKFLIKPINESVKEMYQNHGTFHDGDSGIDLFIIQDEVIPAGETRLVDLGISCQLKGFAKAPINEMGCVLNIGYDPVKYYSYYLYSRSSISKTPLILANGVGIIDSSYLGPIKAALRNIGTDDYTIKRGERYVQLTRPDLEEVSFELVEDFKRVTTRGIGGFGSTLV